MKLINTLTTKKEEEVKMKAYEYYADVMADGHLSIPEKLKNILQSASKIKVVLLLEDEETEWNKFAASQFLKGYSKGDEIYDKL